MKTLLMNPVLRNIYWLILICTIGACKKEKSTPMYSIFISARNQSNFGDYQLQKIVLTSSKGKFIKQFVLANSAYTFDFQPITESSEDSLDVHLIYNNLITDQEVLQVRSFLGIPNGDTLVVDPSAWAYYPSQSGKRVQVQVNQLPEPDSVDVLLDMNDNVPSYDATTRTLSVTATLNYQQDLLLRVKAKGEPTYRYLHIPDAQLKTNEPNRFAWPVDFKNEINFISVKNSSNLPRENTYLFLAAVDDNRTRFTVLHFFYPARKNQITLRGYFNLPSSIATTFSKLYVQLKTPDYEIQKIVPINAALQLEPFPVGVNYLWAANGELIKATYTGPLDVEEVEVKSKSEINEYWPHLRWNIYGPPGSLRNYRIPELSTAWPSWEKLIKDANRYSASAHYYGQHDWTQVRKGKPHRENGWFSVGNSDFYVVKKQF